MTDVTNPGLVNVADEVEGNPDPNGGTSRWTPREDDVLVPAADAGYPPAPVQADVFPTPSDVEVGGPTPLFPVLSSPVPPAAEVDVAAQSFGQGAMVPVDPLDPAAGSLFRSPDEFVVVGPTTSFQTNRTETDQVAATIAAVLDADALPTPAGPTTTRYYIQVATPPVLTSFPVSLLGRQVVFTATTDPNNEGAARLITGYGGNYVVINRDDETPSNGNVSEMSTPQAGDVFVIQVGRQGSEDVSTTGAPAVDVVVAPPPPDFVASAPQAQLGGGTAFVSTGAQPGQPVVSSGTAAPTATDHQVADQYVGGPGLPANVFA
jgi:hypothetical protein